MTQEEYLGAVMDFMMEEGMMLMQGGLAALAMFQRRGEPDLSIAAMAKWRHERMAGFSSDGTDNNLRVAGKVLQQLRELSGDAVGIVPVDWTAAGLGGI